MRRVFHTRVGGARAPALVVLALLGAAAGCDVNPYQLGTATDDAAAVADDGGDGPGDAGADGDGATTADAAPHADACLPAPETCDERDEDCDDLVDEGFDLLADPNHCGACGNACLYPHAFGTCSAGTCVQGDCVPGFVDLDGDPGTGCEYFCIPTSGGVEGCDGVDNDCDGATDEGFTLDSDVANCGACGNVCTLLHATAACVGGTCQVATCDSGYVDVDPAVPGCELFCSPTGAELCDGVDNDCDGTTDEGNPGGGAACGSAVGECAPGATLCSFGILFCVGAVSGTPELCDGKDNDCDGATDDGFDLLSDPGHCGPSCAVCAFPHAVVACVAGACALAACDYGYYDKNGLAADGCEHACTVTGVEVCDGLDNDCDGLYDAADPDLATPPGFCKTAGECAGAALTAAGAAGWQCNYAALIAAGRAIQLAAGEVVLEETSCDGKDNDCDGGADEVFPLKGTACAQDGTFGSARKLGACRGTGTLVCNGAGDGLVCNITAPGATATSELCNAVDDDCDGHVDEPYDFSALLGVRDALVGPLTIGGLAVVMHRYEASRPDATATSAGLATSRACATAGRAPWAMVSLAEATAACAAAGMRLCRVTRDGAGAVTSDEWGRFCQGGSDFYYPYSDVYDPLTCNGSDYDPVPGGVNEDQAVATGSLASCVTSEAGTTLDAYDQSGNLKEWVDDPRAVSGTTVYTLRGGSFDNHAVGLTCDFDFTVATASFRFPNLGFRCCARSCAAGQSDCGGVCVNLATSASHCGACGAPCGPGQTCQNGYCCPTGTVICADQCVAPGTCP
jgi:hypothetical protein